MTAAGGSSNDPIQPLLVKTITYRTAPVQTASLAPDAGAGAGRQLPPPAGRRAGRPHSPQRFQMTHGCSTSTSSSSRRRSLPRCRGFAGTEAGQGRSLTRAKPSTARPTARPRARGGWLIQIGAFEGEDEAKAAPERRAGQNPRHACAADPFTERVQKGDKAFYRARFAGLRQGDGGSRLQTAQTQRYRLYGCEKLKQREPAPSKVSAAGFRRHHAPNKQAWPTGTRDGDVIDGWDATRGSLGISAMAAKQHVLGLIDASRKIRRPPLVGMQFLHEGSVSTTDFLRARPGLKAKDLISLLFSHFAAGERCSPAPLPHHPARVHASGAPCGQDKPSIAGGCRRRSREAGRIRVGASIVSSERPSNRPARTKPRIAPLS